MDKLPPIEKINEAWSALADGRVQVDESSQTAQVKSSDGAKTYTVTWREPGDGSVPVYTSNDNATYWKLYPGYPVIAVMMHRGLLPYDKEWAQNWGGINWTALNAANKRDYAKAVSDVLGIRGIDADLSARRAGEVWNALAELPAAVRRGSLRPPK